MLREFVFYYVSPRIKSRSSGLTACGPHLYLLGVHPFPFPRIVRYHQASDHAEFRQMQVLICSALLIILPGTCPTSTLSPGITTTIQREPVLLRMLSLQRLLLTLLVFPCSKWKWWQWALFGLIVELDQDPLCPSSTFTSCILSSAIRTECQWCTKLRAPVVDREREAFISYKCSKGTCGIVKETGSSRTTSPQIYMYTHAQINTYTCVYVHTQCLYLCEIKVHFHSAFVNSLWSPDILSGICAVFCTNIFFSDISVTSGFSGHKRFWTGYRFFTWLLSEGPSHSMTRTALRNTWPDFQKHHSLRFQTSLLCVF